MSDGRVVKPSAWIWSLQGVLCVTALYGFAHAVIRLLLSPVIGEDDVIANLYVQSLEWVYLKKNPPLYEWFLWTVQQFTGPTLISFLILKYVLWTATAGFFYLSAFRILRDAKWAALSAFSLSLCYQIGWNIHEGVTHTAVLCLMLAASFYVFLRVLEEQSLWSYVLFGICIGFGFLSKFGYGAFLALLLAATFLQPSLRERLSIQGLLVSIAVAVVIVAPFLFHLVTDDPLSYGVVKSGGNWEGYFPKLALNFPRALYAPFGFLAPLIIVLPLVFSNFVDAVRGIDLKPVRSSFSQQDIERLLLHMFLAGWVLLIGAVVLFAFQKTAARYMHPLSFLFVIWLIAQAKRGATPIELKRFMYVLGVMVCVVAVVRVGGFVVAEPFCKKCRQIVPYERLAKGIKDAGFQSGLIMGDRRYVSGNLRQLFPGSIVASQRFPRYEPRRSVVGDVPSILFVWSFVKEDRRLSSYEKEIVEQYGGATSDVRVQTIEGRWSHLWREEGYRRSRWQIAVVPTRSSRVNP